MPDPRLLRALRYGLYDEPPASTGSSTPHTRRRRRLQQALRATADMAANDLAEMGASTHPSRRALIEPLQRRRQRSPSAELQDEQAEEDNRRRRSKRRRLEYDHSPTPQLPIKYGHYGQVEAGRLKLNIISCDGGEHRDPRHPSTYLGAQNLLRHDKSVYCSDRPSSGIVFRHADDTPFCLEKLHIVSPEHGFSAPVREGIVYVAMTLADLQKYMDPPQHARLHGIHTPPYGRRRSFRQSPELLTFADALRDPTLNDAADAQNDEHSFQPFGMVEDAYSGSRFSFDRYDSEAHCEGTSSAEPDDIIVSAESSTFPVTLLSDEEAGPEDNSTQEVLDFRLQRLHNMRRRLEMQSIERERERDRERDERWTGVNATRLGQGGDRSSSWGLRHLDAMMARSRMEDSPQRDEAGHDGQHDLYTYHQNSQSYYSKRGQPEETEYYDDGILDPKVTRARFRIREGKCKIAIKFEPAVSGRFILIKLWAHRSNVDVQSVIAKGYGGSRFFPAVEFR
ncbi:unnamed protein product [Zymoseptoria tritici ST99CH_1E4]|uniref:Uncharacterized protein n=1 Tax=Zymoseptoria tritici ST99CH_1E4 TaxID=1276532 RepID=A0A2H1GTG4_ZYMTR|nr:unnamed protein product [Zymoseptoria tritici ST99CH_1E4]